MFIHVWCSHGDAIHRTQPWTLIYAQFQSSSSAAVADLISKFDLFSWLFMSQSRMDKTYKSSCYPTILNKRAYFQHNTKPNGQPRTKYDIIYLYFGIRWWSHIFIICCFLFLFLECFKDNNNFCLSYL